MTHNLTLYADARFTSPYVLSVFVTLIEKKIPFQTIIVDLEANENRTANFARMSLTQRVPAIVDGDFHLSESSAITEYLEEAYPAPAHTAVYPQDRRQRAVARQIQAWLRSDLLPIREERSTQTVFLGPPTGRPLTERANAAAETLIAVARTLIPTGTGNLFGSWCIADTDLALMLQRLIVNGDAVPPDLRTYAEYQWQRPSVRQWLDKVR
jgi:glutathione S-transferase